VALAEASGLADRSVDLVSVAQALHWFDLGRFFAEVQRVARPNAVITGPAPQDLRRRRQIRRCGAPRI
jgi:ubiquinone/menaquinone biosynthesis C-methylase UbiE